MHLPHPFVQLPLTFDAPRLLDEVEAIDPSAWRPHPAGYAGNWGLPLISAGGDPDNEGTSGPMRPTPHLSRLPYLGRVLSRIGAVWGRSRLMRLDGKAEVSAHVDNNYYWRERVRVHVPIRTSPDVTFECGTAQTHMAAGECWIFDTWRPHRVFNAGNVSRIHLVADTVGDERFWTLAASGRTHNGTDRGWAPSHFGSDDSAPEELLLESSNRPAVMSPWEVKEHLHFILSRVPPGAVLNALQGACTQHLWRWRALWARFGDADPSGVPHYRQALAHFEKTIESLHGRTRQENGIDPCEAIFALTIQPGIGQALRAKSTAGAAPKPAARIADPIFILSPPRSGSTLLFETLARAPGICTIGGESHLLIESIAALHPRNRDFESNRLLESDAAPDVAEALRRKFLADLRDRDGSRPAPGAIRMLEKTPKNALRLPFLRSIFPDANFIYLHRHPRDVLSSMLDAWRSGRFVTYPGLPDWQPLRWSLLLVPGWRDLIGRDLPAIVASQWARTVDILLDDMDRLEPARLHIVRYPDFVANPEMECRRLCRRLNLQWDEPLPGPLPLSRHTLSPPDPDKWKRNRTEVEQMLAVLGSRIERLEGWLESRLRSVPA